MDYYIAVKRYIIQVSYIHMLMIYPAIHSPYEYRIKQIFIVFTAELLEPYSLKAMLYQL